MIDTTKEERKIEMNDQYEELGRLRAKLYRVVDAIRFAANSEGGLCAEIEATLEKKKDGEICCPFCGEDGFDLISLRHHLLVLGCEQFERPEMVREEQLRRAAFAEKGNKSV